MTSSLRTPSRARHFGRIATVVALVAGSTLLGVAAPAVADEPVDIGACLVVDDAWSPTSPYAVVECDQQHNAEAYEIVAYPASLGAPSTLSDEQLSGIGAECSSEAFEAWLGQRVGLPLRIWDFFISVPNDDAWAAGERDVVCRSMRPTASNDAMTYTGALPELFTSTPLLQWLNCTSKAPKSGVPNPTANCSSKSKNLLVGGAPVKGKVTSAYPKDLQKAADKACQSAAKKFGKKGTVAVAALLPKDWVEPNSIFTECFIPVAAWNGKVR